MADVERKAEAEAEKKGLSGQAERSYVGGVFNRIKQAHNRATTPGKGKRQLNRAARREARKDAMEQIRYHQAQIKGIREGYHQRVQMDEPRERPQRPSVAKKSAFERAQERAHPNAGEIAREMAARNPQNAPASAPAEQPPAKTEDFGPLPPYIRPPGIPRQSSVSAVDPYELELDYGRDQLPNVLRRASLPNLKRAAKLVKARNPGTRPRGQSKAALVEYITSHMDAPPAPPQAPTREQPAAMARPAKQAPAGQPTREEIRAAKQKKEAEEREYWNQVRRQNKKARRERDEDRYQQNQLLNKHGYHWRMMRDPLHDDDADMPPRWQLLDPQGHAVTVDEALRRIHGGK